MRVCEKAIKKNEIGKFLGSRQTGLCTVEFADCFFPSCDAFARSVTCSYNFFLAPLAEQNQKQKHTKRSIPNVHVYMLNLT
jgi:hypothetical protein